jgi:hypothetical protein
MSVEDYRRYISSLIHSLKLEDLKKVFSDLKDYKKFQVLPLLLFYAFAAEPQVFSEDEFGFFQKD